MPTNNMLKSSLKRLKGKLNTTSCLLQQRRQSCLDCNRSLTPRCKRNNTSHTHIFLTIFVITFGEIFLEYSWNIFENSSKKYLDFFKKQSSYCLLKFMSKIGTKCHFQKIEIHLQIFLLLKNKCYNV
jgi:hypothetical protein